MAITKLFLFKFCFTGGIKIVECAALRAGAERTRLARAESR